MLVKPYDPLPEYATAARFERSTVEMAADRPPVALQMLPGEGENDKERQRPAQERQRHRRNMPGGEAADDGVAGPAQRGDREQQIGLIGEPVAGGGGAGGVI